jgi:hypothetical protein
MCGAIPPLPQMRLHGVVLSQSTWTTLPYPTLPYLTLPISIKHCVIYSSLLCIRYLFSFNVTTAGNYVCMFFVPLSFNVIVGLSSLLS